MESSQTAVSVEAGIGRILLNRPERRNALSLAMLDEMLDKLNELSSNPEVAVLTIAGAGPAFSAGHDSSEMIDRDSRVLRNLVRIVHRGNGAD